MKISQLKLYSAPNGLVSFTKPCILAILICVLGLASAVFFSNELVALTHITSVFVMVPAYLALSRGEAEEIKGTIARSFPYVHLLLLAVLSFLYFYPIQ